MRQIITDIDFVRCAYCTPPLTPPQGQLIEDD
jgi:hypothetical protein